MPDLFSDNMIIGHNKSSSRSSNTNFIDVTAEKNIFNWNNSNIHSIYNYIVFYSEITIISCVFCCATWSLYYLKDFGCSAEHFYKNVSRTPAW